MTAPKPDWRILSRRMKSVRITCVSDGKFFVEPQWCPRYGGLVPAGSMSRYMLAQELERLINAKLKGPGRPKRVPSHTLTCGDFT